MSMTWTASPTDEIDANLERRATETRALVTFDLKSGVYTLGAPGSLERNLAAHKAQRCAAHWPARCTCEGRRL